jgi:hypothetical protein
MLYCLFCVPVNRLSQGLQLFRVCFEADAKMLLPADLRQGDPDVISYRLGRKSAKLAEVPA